MARIIAQDEALIVTTTERTWRVQIHCTEGQDYVLEAFREQIRRAGETDLGRDPNAAVVRRALSAVAGDSYTCADGTEVSVPHLAEALAGLIEQWRDVDLTPVAPAPEPEVEE